MEGIWGCIKMWDTYRDPATQMSPQLVRYLEHCYRAYLLQVATHERGRDATTVGRRQAFDPNLYNNLFNLAYKVYSSITKQPAPDYAETQSFFNQLNLMGCPIRLQSNSYVLRTFLELSCSVPRDDRRDPDFMTLYPNHVTKVVERFSLGHVDAKALKEMQRAFYHYGMVNGGRETTKRIYLNVHNGSRGTVMKWVHGNICGRPGISSAKSAAPSGWKRQDAALIYCQDDTAREDALAQLRAYQALTFGRGFERELPHMVKPADDLIGVGIADEPPRSMGEALRGAHEIFGTFPERLSFGTSRAHIVAFALEHMRMTGGGKKYFLARAGAYMQFAGVDVRNPDRHTDENRMDASLESIMAASRNSTLTS